MKKIIYCISVITLCLGFISHFHHVHVHAYAPGDVYGQCPVMGCDGSLVVFDMFENPTCTSQGHLFVMCNVCGHGEDVYPAALGHEYDLDEHREATCLDKGYSTYKCTRCGDTYTDTISALGHDYVSKITKKVTCEENGVMTYTCSRCSDSYTNPIKATGHNFVYEEKEATCLEDGYKKGKCKNCDKTTEEIYKALGHDLTEAVVSKQATCTQDGEKKAECKRCGEFVVEKIPKLGHKYPDEWTVEKEAGYFSEGLEIKVCEHCSEIITQIIPKKDPTLLIASSAGGLLLAASVVFLYLKKKIFKKKVEEIVEEVDDLSPSFSDKNILVASKDENLISILKSKHYLEVVTCEYEQLETGVEENEPDLLIVDVLSKETLEEMISKKEESLAETEVSFIVSEELLKDKKEELDNLKKDKKISSYIPYGSNDYQIMIKVILPILKPEFRSDESLSNIGMIADILGIPGVSKIIDVYVSGRDLKATLQEEEKGTSEYATIISDIASILGFDKVAEVAGLVDDIDSIKGVFNKEAGAYEGKSGISGAKDIVDVVKDLTDKE